MATAAKTATQVAMESKARSIELAQAKGHTACSHAARIIGWVCDGEGDLTSAAWRIASATSDAEYTVGYLAFTDDADCDCRAGQFGRPCWHRGLGIIIGRELARIYSPAGRAESERAYRADVGRN